MKIISITLAVSTTLAMSLFAPSTLHAAKSKDPYTKKTIARGLAWLARKQARTGQWTGRDNAYKTAMTALAANALLMEGSTTTQGKYQENIRLAVDYLISRTQKNGLIGIPSEDDRYTYGHGFSMLFLSQVLGEEEDEDRRKRLVAVLEKAVEFTGRAQTKAGGWGYVSAKDGGGFDEGSTTVTQIQGLRACRNAGIKVPKEIIDKAVKYIHKCTRSDGGVQYSTQGGGGRVAITAAAIACLFNASQYDDKYVPRLLKYCKKNLSTRNSGSGHWHYAHYYYSQVMYREGGKTWTKYRDTVYADIAGKAKDDGKYAHWPGNYIGNVYITSVNLTILQLDKALLPIYQR